MTVDSVLRQDADGGMVEMGKRHVINTAGQKSNLAPARAGRGKDFADLAEEKFLVNLRRQAVEIGDSKKFQQAGLPQESLQAGSLVEAHQPGHEAQPAKVDHDLSVEEITQEPRQQRPCVLFFDLRACPLHDVPVLNAGGTSRLA